MGIVFESALESVGGSLVVGDCALLCCRVLPLPITVGVVGKLVTCALSFTLGPISYLRWR